MVFNIKKLGVKIDSLRQQTGGYLDVYAGPINLTPQQAQCLIEEHNKTFKQARISAISECLATLEEGITFYEALIEGYPHSDDLEKKYTAKMEAIKTMRGEINNLMEKEGGK